MRREARQFVNAEAVAEREQIWAVCLLAWVAAFTDAIGFIVLQQLGASYMSGNSMTAGVALGRGDWAALINHGLPILSFVTGILLGVSVLELAKRLGLRLSFGLIFGLEIICLFAFFLVGDRASQEGVIRPSETSAFYLCLIMLTLAMGLQTTTLRKIRGQSVRTTFVTGVLSDLTNALINYLPWLFTQLKKRRFRLIVNESRRSEAFQNILLLGGIFGFYIFGAACGSALERRLSLTALIFPIGALVVLVIADIVRPFENSNTDSKSELPGAMPK